MIPTGGAGYLQRKEKGKERKKREKKEKKRGKRITR
jgi:hypothetical protein